MSPQARIRDHLSYLYDAETAGHLWPRLQALLDGFRRRNPHRPASQTAPAGRFDERDVILITYGDMVYEAGQPPLRSLAEFLETTLPGVVTGVHLLPFFPYSSDDGFSVIDYKAVNPALGSWDDVARIGGNFRLMFDAVVNHVSVQSDWFGRFLAGDPRYQEYFVVPPGDANLSQVFRPRALPLLTPFQTAAGEKLVWTTFSADQVDLNFKNPDVLLEILDVLLFYVEQGAEFIRLDAIAFLWKESGTACLHRPQTHRLVQLFRAVLDEVAPTASLITETNVPHQDNIAYFGDGANEAQMVYNFSLPPLVLHAFHSGQATTLATWARGLDLPSAQASFFNFLASHDGIG
ncbi:MAG: sugar phosphorylase, partial [Chloroflexi bacterium]|nr:sugar phosphorylase [Chloroflexota bacterium]